MTALPKLHSWINWNLVKSSLKRSIVDESKFIRLLWTCSRFGLSPFWLVAVLTIPRVLYADNIVLLSASCHGLQQKWKWNETNANMLFIPETKWPFTRPMPDKPSSCSVCGRLFGVFAASSHWGHSPISRSYKWGEVTSLNWTRSHAAMLEVYISRTESEGKTTVSVCYCSKKYELT